MKAVPQRLLNAFCKNHGISQESLFDKKSPHTYIRQAAMYLCYLHYRSSFDVARLFKVQKDSVLKGVNAIVDSGEAQNLRKKFDEFLET